MKQRKKRISRLPEFLRLASAANRIHKNFGTLVDKVENEVESLRKTLEPLAIEEYEFTDLIQYEGLLQFLESKLQTDDGFSREQRRELVTYIAVYGFGLEALFSDLAEYLEVSEAEPDIDKQLAALCRQCVQILRKADE